METKDEIKTSINIRLPKDNKSYYEYQIKKFVSKFDSDKLLSIQFGKQDITLIDKSHCEPNQKFFYNKWELLGFVCGFNSGTMKTKYSDFGQWLK